MGTGHEDIAKVPGWLMTYTSRSPSKFRTAFHTVMAADRPAGEQGLGFNELITGRIDSPRLEFSPSDAWKDGMFSVKTARKVRNRFLLTAAATSRWGEAALTLGSKLQAEPLSVEPFPRILRPSSSSVGEAEFIGGITGCVVCGLL